MQEEVRSHRHSRLRLYISLFIAWGIVPIALIVLFEISLRAAGFGYSTKPFNISKIDGKDYAAVNLAFFTQFMPMWHDKIIPEPYDVVIPVEKPANTYRIGMLGSSAGLGYLNPEYGCWHVLETILKTKYPDVNFEVYYLGWNGMNSHVMRYMMDSAKFLNFDLIAVYMGNNEVKGTLSALYDVHWLLPTYRYAQLHATLSNTRIMQLICKTLRISLGRPKNPRSWGAGTGINSPDDPHLQIVYKNYRKNVEAICDSANEANANVILSSVGVNLRSWITPGSTHRKDMGNEDMERWEKAYKEGSDLEQSGAYAEAKERYAKALAIDDQYSELCFRYASCALALNDEAEAKKYYLRAHDVDAALITASRAINDSLREIAEQRAKDGVMFVDSAARLNELSPHGLSGNEFFEDHVHMTFSGSYVVASTIFDAIKDRLPDWVKKDQVGGSNAPSIEECKTRLAVTPVEELNLAVQSVAKNQSMHNKKSIDFFLEIQKRLEQDLQGKDKSKIDADGCRRALELNPCDIYVRTRCAYAILQTPERQEAEPIARETVTLFPHLWRARALLATTLDRLGKRDEALEIFRQQVVNFPNIAESHFVLGNMFRNRGRKQEALDEYRKAAELKPINDVALVAEGQVLEEMGDWIGAKKAYISAIKTIPEQEDLYPYLHKILKDKAEGAERLACWKHLARTLGYVSPAYVYYGVAMDDLGDKTGAITEYRRALELKSNNPLLLARFGEALVEGGNTQEASGFLRRAAEAGLAQKDESPKLIAALRALNINDLADKEEQRCKSANIPLSN